jgi:hypothetical protein
MKSLDICPSFHMNYSEVFINFKFTLWAAKITVIDAVNIDEY